MLRVPLSETGPDIFLSLIPRGGKSILRYMREVRPSGFGRCASLHHVLAPIRPLGRGALGKIVRGRLARLGIVAGGSGERMRCGMLPPSIF